MFVRVDLLIKWWRTWGTLPVMPWVRAAHFYRLGKYTLAEKSYEAGLKKYRGHPAELCARLDLAYCLFKAQKFEEAEKHLRTVTAQLPTSREAFLRLGKLQQWTGRTLDAAWTMRRALKSVGLDEEILAFFLLAVLENEGPAYMLREAIDYVHALPEPGATNARLRAGLVRARFSDPRQKKSAQKELEQLACQPDAPLESIVLFAEALLAEGAIDAARQQLRRAMIIEPDHPRVLSLCAESYLKSGEFYNPDYARQLATSACQNSGWLSPREMHVLAESYFHTGDKVSALIMAEKAKQVGSRLLGEYRNVKNLERLIEELSTGTLA